MASAQASDERTRSESRRDELVAVAARVFAEKGYANATIRDIGAAAGIIPGSLYYHFDSKEALLEAIVAPVYDDLLVEYERVAARLDDPRRALEQLVEVGLRFVIEQQHVARILQNDYAYLRTIDRFAFIRERSNEIRRIWHDVLTACHEAGVVAEDVDWADCYRYLMGTIQSTARWFDPRGRVSASEAVPAITAMLLDGIAR
jgi:AcrR family transcriptional regulator